MPAARFLLQPTLRQLLGTEALLEAQVLFGEELLDRQVTQVISGWSGVRSGSLVVTRTDALVDADAQNLSELAGVLAIRASATALAGVGGGALRTNPTVGIDVNLNAQQKLCAQAKTPLLVMSGIGEPLQIVDEVRAAWLTEVKRCSSRLHNYFISQVLEGGLAALVQELSQLIGRPAGVETTDFKILAAHNLGPTPAGQQKVLTEEIEEEVNRQIRCQDDDEAALLPQQPVRVGRRLVMPVLLEGVVAGYLSVMVRPGDDFQSIGDYMVPAALAAMVDFNQRRREVSAFAVTRKGLLKDLVAGRTLSASDQERLEQQFGFDLCDGFLVFALNLLPDDGSAVANNLDDSMAWVDFEGTRVFVLPYHERHGRTLSQEAQLLVDEIKKRNPGVGVQLGASRLSGSLLDVPDSYREARHALIIGSIANPDNEYMSFYDELGVRRLLYLLIDHPDLERFYQENLAPLEAYDAEWESELVPTLKVYLEHGANLNSAAKALFIHRHTMRYRLEQIADILKVDIDSQTVLLNLQIAFLIREMKGASPS